MSYCGYPDCCYEFPHVHYAATLPPEMYSGELRVERPAILDQVADLKARLAEALALLREVEWTEDQCPTCRGWRPHPIVSGMVVIGHAPDCRLAKVLEEKP